MKLLISYDSGYSPAQLREFEKLGFEVHLLEDESRPVPDELLDSEAIICYLLFNYNDISQFKNLRLIHTTSAGLDHMPLQYINAKGIQLYNARGVYSAPMAEFALSGVLQLYKHAARFAEQQRLHLWQPDATLLELGGKQVCVVGAGSIGTQVAKRFSAMGCTVTGVCRTPRPTAYFDRVCGIDALDELLPQSDVVIFTVPLTDQTRHMLNARRLAQVKDGAVLVNLSRGPVADTEALCAELKKGRLLGAVLDVFETEPLPASSPLWDLPNVLVTPHNSFSGDRNIKRLFELVYTDFSEYLYQTGEM